MRLTARERRWAEQVMAALLPAETAGLPALADLDRSTFWRCVEERGAPTLVPGLRAMLLAVQLLPVRRFGRRFSALTADERERFLAALDADPRWLPRQLVATFKVLACFAWFDDPRARAAVDP